MASDSDPSAGAQTGRDDEPHLAFGRQVRDALVHLNDFAVLQRLPLVQFVRSEGSARGPNDGKALQQALRDAIGALRPPSSTDPLGPVGRSYHLLTLRYVEGLEVASVLPKLALGRSEYYRDHQRALDELSALLWECWHGAAAPDRPRPRTNLPAALTSFIGREREIAAVTRALATTRLLTLTGTGGCGKTRLALQVAAALPDPYPDGVWVVELASLADPALLPQTVAVALGLREGAGRPILGTLITHLEAKELLLLLDNCEHLIEAAAQLAHVLLRSCPRLRILATSREALGVAGETSWRVPSLPLPPPEEDAVDNVRTSEAARLFVERARTVQPSFALTSANAAAVGQICRRLDGIPLAIELAAARVRVLSVEQIARRVDDRFRFLTGGSRSALPRQQTLRATLDWSYALLTEPERALFRRLAVFVGGFSLEGAEAVGAPLGGEAGDVLDLLIQLVDKSLVVVEEAGEARYRLLETVRQYGQERLVEAGDAPAARDRHRDWYVALAERSEPELRGPGQREWGERLEIEHDNLRSALEWSLESDPAAGVRLAGNLWRFWAQRGYFGEGRRWLQAVLARTSATGGPGDDGARAWALLGLGNLTGDQGDLPGAQGVTEESLALFRATGDRRGLTSALRLLGECLLYGGGAAERARSVLEESLRLARAAADQRAVGLALRYLGVLAVKEREDARARHLMAEALALFRQIGDSWQVNSMLWMEGWFALGRGDFPRARQYLEEALASARRLGYKHLVGLDLLGLGCLAHLEGDQRQARVFLQESVRLFRETGAPGIYRALGYLGYVGVERGRYAWGVCLLAVAEVAEVAEMGEISPFLPSALKAEREVRLAVARAALGEEAFAATWVEGQAMTLEQAVEYTLIEQAD